MGFGNFWQGMMGSPVGQFAKRVDQGFVNRALAGETAARNAGIGRQQRQVLNMDGEQLFNRLTTEAGMADKGARKVADEFMRRRGAMDAQGMISIAARVAPDLNRGPGGIGQMGLMERLSNQAATNRYIRRGAYPALAAGGAVAGGAALTAGAQQLMALMGYMNESQQTAQRTEESPLLTG